MAVITGDVRGPRRAFAIGHIVDVSDSTPTAVRRGTTARYSSAGRSSKGGAALVLPTLVAAASATRRRHDRLRSSREGSERAQLDALEAGLLIAASSALVTTRNLPSERRAADSSPV